MAPFTWLADSVRIEMLVRLVAALLVGAVIGAERTHRGRPAGFRTHALVCLSTSLLMLVTVYQSHWFPTVDANRVVIDPTRMAQGIMTGLGFLGAGAIIRDGTSVRGLTTAASIWVTAGIGVLIGIGFYFPAVAAAALTIGTLAVFQTIEDHIPTRYSANFSVRLTERDALSEVDLRRMLSEHGLEASNVSHWLDRRQNFFEYSMVVHARSSDSAVRLCNTLAGREGVFEFRLAPLAD